MPITFKVVQRGSSEKNQGATIAYLEIDSWNDYSFRTSFNLTVFDSEDKRYDLGYVKIGFLGQTTAIDTDSRIPQSFTILDDFFSLGQDVEYYKKIYELPVIIREQVLKGLKDIANDNSLLDKVKNEEVFKESLTRNVALSTIRQQFSRVLNGDVALTEYKFSYHNSSTSEISLDFVVQPESTPPTNIHVLIGRNGAGKTTLLHNMIYSLFDKSGNENQYGNFFNLEFGDPEEIPEDYFSSVVFVSFSVFDSFNLVFVDNKQENLKFSYIGLKKVGALTTEIKNKNILCDEFIDSLKACLCFDTIKNRWLSAISYLQSDDNFAEMGLEELAESNSDINDKLILAKEIFEQMSSGHALVLLTITKLVLTVEEKTLVLIDEPEGHLHPPLLSAFIHALSNLLINRNGVGVIATHSPVVLQEVPRNNVWNIVRSNLHLKPQRLEMETYGENVGILTREIFGLEVRESGFHKVLVEFVEAGKSYDEILNEYQEKLGFEGRAILRALIFNREKRQEKKAKR